MLVEKAIELKMQFTSWFTKLLTFNQKASSNEVHQTVASLIDNIFDKY